MPVFPSEGFEIHSPLDRDAAVRALADRVEPWRTIRLFAGQKPFHGNVSSERFLISRIAATRRGMNRTAYMPVITGAFEPMPSGTKVTVRIEPNAIADVVLVCGSLVTAASLAAMAVGLAPFQPAVFFVPLVFVVVIADVVGSFRSQAREHREMLNDIFGAHRDGDSSVPTAK